LELRAEEGRNISHGHLDEVKEILKKLGDDPFGNKKDSSRLWLAGARTW
jgi:hypothetical protein